MQENSKHDVLGDVVPALTLPTWFEYSRVMEAGLFLYNTAVLPPLKLISYNF